MENIQNEKLFHELQKVCDVLVRNVNTDSRSIENRLLLATEILNMTVSKGKRRSKIIKDKGHPPPFTGSFPLLGIFTSSVKDERVLLRSGK